MNKCDCDACKGMKNPVNIHHEEHEEDGLPCTFDIIRDEGTQHYRAVVAVHVSGGESLLRGADFHIKKGVSQPRAIKAICEQAAEDGILDALLDEAHEAVCGESDEQIVEQVKRQLTEMFQQAAQQGVTPGGALREHMERVMAEADRQLAQDPFRPVVPKAKSYLN